MKEFLNRIFNQIIDKMVLWGTAIEEYGSYMSELEEQTDELVECVDWADPEKLRTI